MIRVGAVGDRWNGPHGGGGYSCTLSFEHRLAVVRDVLDPDEALSVGLGKARFALYVEGSCMVLLCRFGDREWCAFPVPWFECSGIISRRMSAGAAAPETVRLVIHLVAAGAIAAVRYATFSPAFTGILNDTLLSFMGRTWPGCEVYAAWARSLCELKPGLAWMAAHSAVSCEHELPEGQPAALELFWCDEEEYW